MADPDIDIQRPVNTSIPNGGTDNVGSRLFGVPVSFIYTLKNRGIEITTTTLDDGEEGLAYSQVVVAAGGTAPLAWAISSGSLPPGLTIDAGTGEISGTPTTSGNYTFTVEVTDDIGNVDTQSFTVDIYEPVVITTASLPDETEGVAYDQDILSSDGLGPYTLAVTSGSIPAGLTFTDNGDGTATIDGTPNTVATYNFTVTITDALGATDDQDYTIDITAAGLSFTPDLHVMSDPDGYLTLIGSSIDVMLDQSPNGFDLSLAGGNYATRSTSHQLDGLNSIDATDGNVHDYRTASGVTQEDVFPSGDGTVIAVLEVQSYTNFFGEEDWIFGTTLVSNSPFSISVISGPKFRFRVTNGSGHVVDIAVSTDTKYVIIMHWDNTIKLKAQVDNGTEQQHASGGTFDSLTQSRIQMLADQSTSGGRFDGWLWELIAKDGDVGATAISSAKAYLKSKYASLNV